MWVNTLYCAFPHPTVESCGIIPRRLCSHQPFEATHPLTSTRMQPNTVLKQPRELDEH
jgi:hypothetical protein